MTTQRQIRQNTVLLALCLVTLSGVLQLAAAVATITLVLVTGIESVLGLGPAIFLTAGALAALPAGRLMDRYGRVPVLAGGFVVGLVGCVLTALGCVGDSAPLVILGFLGVGGMNGAVLLARTAVADMYPEPRKARAISYVLFGALFGAALGPLVFRPLFAGKELELDTLIVPWFAAAAMCVVGLILTLAIRPDPRTVAFELERAGLAPGAEPTTEPAAPLGQILRRPGVPAAVVAAVASLAVMASVMNLSGYIVVGHDHEQADVFTVISVHIVGMFGLVLVVGQLVDRVGRHRALIGGLLVMAVSTVLLAWVIQIPGMSLSLFLLGLGWNVSYVAASAELVTHAKPVERQGLVGFTDLIAGLSAAALALIGGLAYSEWGVVAIAVGATVAVFGPAVWLSVARRPPAVAPEAA
ncbi:MAG: major facilitator superfamily 1 [Gaiellaceae bacterium]|nr:major facilitator superfamily 1 [Gaiellaceae bacterium]